MSKTIQQYLESIEAKHGEAVAQVYSDFLFNLYETNIDAFVEQSVANGFTVTLEWVREYKPDI